jgi:hypothetical protein
MAAYEESTYVVTATFTNEAGTSVVPTSVKWSLLNTDGTIKNGRSQVSVATIATSVNIVLKATDLTVITGDTGDRILLVEATYTSSYGTGLPLKKEYPFNITRLKGIT